ncbi:MAG: adenylyltransferase/cytidyltransferase family protein [archaeon]
MDFEQLKGKGRIVLAGGTFDIIHPGHIYFLKKAKELGDYLVVVVARDSTVKRLKRTPIIPENQRLDVIRSLKPVDFAVLGRENEDFIEIVKEIRPDVIVLGPNQIHDVSEFRAKIEKAGLNTEIKRLDELKKNPLYSTKQIIKKIRESQTDC